MKVKSVIIPIFLALLGGTLVEAQQPPQMIPLEPISLEGKAAPAFDLARLGGGQISF